MKRFFILAFLCGIFFCANAQKKYVTFYVSPSDGYEVVLSGAIPSTMKSTYLPSDYGGNKWKDCIGDLLNILAGDGFTLEQMNTSATTNAGNVIFRTFYLFSKYSSDSDSSDATPKLRANTDSEVTEVARYNLQGIPVKATDKGLQIVVYSNYTTKTVIVE